MHKSGAKVTAQSSIGSNEYAFDLVEAHLVAAAIVELRRARVGMVGHARLGRDITKPTCEEALTFDHQRASKDVMLH
jgi:hypothetical protein